MKLGIVGFGKMGQLVKYFAEQKQIEVCAIIDPYADGVTHKKVDHDSLKNVDVVIEFALADVFLKNLNYYISNQVNAVIATTGWYEQLETIKQKVENSQIGLIWSGNFSIGVNLFFKILSQTAQLMNSFSEYDVFGYELHHNRKKDSPSGTMKMMGDILLDKLGRKDSITTQRLDRQIEGNEIHLASVRGGGVPGTHAITFDSEVDSIELKHQARSRQGFATGSLKAAEWICGKKGFFHINDMMQEIIGGN